VSSSDLQAAFQLIDSNTAIADFSGPKDETLIEKAEAVLKVTFPNTYRLFLNRLGCGGIRGAEFYGVVHEDFEKSGIPDAVWLTLKHRKNSNAPHAVIPISDTGDGAYYALDLCQTSPSGESPVVEWWPGLPDASGNRRIVAEDFGAFLLQRVREALQWKR
jgi:antitoxin YobK